MCCRCRASGAGSDRWVGEGGSPESHRRVGRGTPGDAGARGTR